MTEEQIVDRVNGARCFECRTEMDEIEVKDVIETLDFPDVESLTEALYDAKSCSCDATTVPMIISPVPIFGDAEVDNDYLIRGAEGRPDMWTYEVDDDLVDLVA